MNAMMNKYQFKTFVKVRELLSDPEHWTKEASARSSNGQSVPPCDKKACSWCLYGAIVKASHETGYTNRQLLRNQLCRMVWRRVGSFLAEWNDAEEREHKDVMNLLDGFIKDYERNEL